MERQVHVFPAEAAALALVLLAADLKGAVIAAVGIFVFSILSAALYGKKGVPASVLKVLFGIIYMAYFCGFVFLLEGYSYKGHFSALAVGLSICLVFFLGEDSQCEKGIEDSHQSYLKDVLKQGALASVIILAAGFLRELLSAGSLWGVTVTASSAVSSFYGKTAVGLIVAGLMLAAVSAAFKLDFSNKGTIFVLIPVAISLMVDARGIAGIAKQVFVLVILLAALFNIRKRLIFSETGRPFIGLPIELIMSGLLYMILSWL